MNITRNIYERKSNHILISIAEKVATYSVIPLFLVAIFEAVVKNLIFIDLANLVIVAINKAQSMMSRPPAPAPEAAPAPAVAHIVIPVAAPEAPPAAAVALPVAAAVAPPAAAPVAPPVADPLVPPAAAPVVPPVAAAVAPPAAAPVAPPVADPLVPPAAAPVAPPVAAPLVLPPPPADLAPSALTVAMHELQQKWSQINFRQYVPTNKGEALHMAKKTIVPLTGLAALYFSYGWYFE